MTDRFSGGYGRAAKESIGWHIVTIDWGVRFSEGPGVSEEDECA